MLVEPEALIYSRELLRVIQLPCRSWKIRPRCWWLTPLSAPNTDAAPAPSPALKNWRPLSIHATTLPIAHAIPTDKHAIRCRIGTPRRTLRRHCTIRRPTNRRDLVVEIQQYIHRASMLTALRTTRGGRHGLTKGQQGFYDPVNEKFTEPQHPGISYSFTEDGYFESSYFRAIANRTLLTELFSWKNRTLIYSLAHSSTTPVPERYNTVAARQIHDSSQWPPHPHSLRRRWPPALLRSMHSLERNLDAVQPVGRVRGMPHRKP